MQFKWPDLNIFDIKKHTILLGLAGSRSYGTDHPDSDWDYKGIAIPPSIFYTSPFKNFEQTSWKTGENVRVSERDAIPEAEAEGTVFGIQKFANLASQCNPNIVELLFIKDEHILHETSEGRELRKNRDLFLSQRAVKTYTGYAMSQLNRIRTHKSWLDNPPKAMPCRADYKLPEEKLMSNEKLMASIKFIENYMHHMAPWLLTADNQHREGFWEGVAKIISVIVNSKGLEFSLDENDWVSIQDIAQENIAGQLGFDSNFVEYLKSEKAYSQAYTHWKQYLAWKQNRNPARADLESRYGYDAKHAMHLVRLLRMGEEILTLGQLNVFRPDHQELIEIRNGSWPYEKLIEWADERVTIIYDLVRQKKCVIPEIPDQNKIEDMVINLQHEFWKREE